VITRKPHDEFEVEADYEWGAYDRQRWRGAINVPLLDELMSARFSFVSEDRTGYQKNLTAPSKGNRADDADDLGLRAQLSIRPLDSLDVLLSYNYYRAKGVGPGAKLVGRAREVACLDSQPQDLIRENAQRRPPVIFLGITPQSDGTELWRFSDGSSFLRGFARRAVTRHTANAYCADLNTGFISDPPTEDPSDARLVYLDQIQEQSNKIWGWAGTVTWDVPELPLLGATRLTSITGFQSTALSDPRDFDTIDIPFFSLTKVDNDSYQYSSELKLESAAGDSFDWVGGLFFHRERSEAEVSGTVFGAAFGVDIGQTNIVKSYGVYGETKWHLTEALTLGVGARFSRDFKETQLFRRNGISFNQGTGISAVKTCLPRDEQIRLGSELSRQGLLISDSPPRCEDDWRRWTGGIALEYRPSDAHLVYAQFDTGYKAGGFIVADSGDFDPETVLAYTVGSKSLFFSDRLTLNLEAFYYDYEDYQVVEIDGLSIRTENAPEARVYGIEAEFDTEPLPGLRFNGQIGYLNAEYTDYESIDPIDASNASRDRVGLPVIDADAIQDLSGNQLARAPKWSYTIGAEYRFPIRDWGTLTPRIQYYWQDDTYYRAYNGCAGTLIQRGLCSDPDIDLQESYHRTDIKLIWNSPEERWSFEAYVENLEDDDVFQNLLIGSSAVGSPALAQYSGPRIYGFRIGLRY
jgi:iron complex outermembrane receptor protein